MNGRLNTAAPIRCKKRQVPLYVIGWDRGYPILGRQKEHGSGGMAYGLDGLPKEDWCPWGEVENYDALEGLVAGDWEDVEPPKGAEPTYLNSEDWETVPLPKDMRERQRRATARLKAQRAEKEAKREEAKREAERLQMEASMGSNPLWGAF